MTRVHSNPAPVPCLRLFAAFAALLLLLCPCTLAAQTTLTLSGQVLDPASALIPGATITLTRPGDTHTTVSDAAGHYELRGLTPGTYQLTADAPGFAQLVLSDLSLTASRQLNLSLKIVTAEQHVTVNTDATGLSVSNSDNVNSTVIKGADLDALSDDPDQLRNQLMALAGPSAGPDGGQIYIDGFTSNQLPPKSSILEVRVNQNPFSAENDRIGYGRIDIITKPSAAKFVAHARYSFVSSALDTSNPLVTSEPGYFYYSFSSDATGPLTKNASWFGAANYWQRQRQLVVNAVDPNNVAGRIAQAYPSPYSTFYAYPRIDFQAGKHVLSIRDIFYRTRTTGGGVGALSLPSQAYSNTTHDNTLTFRDFMVLSPSLVNELGFQWEHGADGQLPDNTTPAVSVSGAFTTGGSSAGQSSDHDNLIELHDYMTATRALHVFRFGFRLRSFADTSLSTAGVNGTYTFSSLAQYSAGTPSQFSYTVVQHPTVKILSFDAHLFFQDEWRARPNLSIGYGLRVQGQSRNHDPADFAPRFALTWAPHNDGHTAPRFAIRAGAGLFYSALFAGNMLQTIRQNGSNQQNYVIANPGFYAPTTPGLPSGASAGSASTPSIYTLAPHFHTELSTQAGAGIDRSLGKVTAFNISYLFTQGSHQFYTDLVTAPAFNPATYTTSGPTPSVYNFQYQSGGIFRQHQLILTARTQLRRLSLSGTYTFNHARGDTQGLGSSPLDAQDPGLDYGRTSFAIVHQLQAIGTWSLPHGFTLGAVLFAQSGTPYNITTGSDLTGTTLYNSRPTFGTCNSAGVVTTAFGCLDTDPTGKGEPIAPINLGTGPANRIVNLTLGKSVGVGPRLKQPAQPDAVTAAVNAANAQLRPGEISRPAAALPEAPRRYSLTFQAGVSNLFNIVNRGTPNGALSCSAQPGATGSGTGAAVGVNLSCNPLFGQSQTLAGGAYTLPAPGNRVFYLNTTFTF